MHSINFLTKGLVGFVLPRKGCTYIMIEPGDTFGVIDVTHNIQKVLEHEKAQNRFISTNDEIMKLRF